LPIFKYATILAPSRNKNLISKHHFLLFIVVNNVIYFVNNDPNQKSQKSKPKNNYILKHKTVIYNSNKNGKNKEEKIEME
jgi:hypothetical protein